MDRGSFTHHHFTASARRTAEAHHIIHAIHRRQASAVVLFDHDIQVGVLAPNVLAAFGVPPGAAPKVTLRVRHQRHIRTRRGAAAKEVLRYLEEALANARWWAPGGSGRRRVLGAASGLKHELLIVLDQAPGNGGWWCETAFPYRKARRDREAGRFHPIGSEKTNLSVVITDQ